jgi:hypothetical protein
MHAVPIVTVVLVMEVGETLPVRVALRARAIHGGVNAGCSSVRQRRMSLTVASVMSSLVKHLRPISILTTLLVRGTQ